MSEFSHCQHCGRRLRDVIFCPVCGEWVCSATCLDEHMSQHLGPMATPAGPVAPAAENAPLRDRQGIAAAQERAALRAYPWRSTVPGDYGSRARQQGL